MSIKLPMPEYGKDTTETVDILFDTVLKLRKELDYALQHLDDENIPDLPDMKTDISNGASQIQVNSDNIALKVDADGVIAAINLSSEGVTIQGDKINLVGAVTVLSDITGQLGTITAGTINGININSATIDISESITIGDNIYLGDQTDQSITKRIYFNSGANIHNWQNAGFPSLGISAHTLELVGVQRFQNSAGTTYFYGTWDFSNATVTGLP